MKLLKNPILWIVIVVAATVYVGYQVTVQTALQQSALKNNRNTGPTISSHAYNLYSVTTTPPDRVWAVGSGGILLHSTDNGDTWAERQLGAPEQVFSSISFPDKNNGWVVGTRGMILHTTDGGKEWNRINRKEKIFFTKVFFLDVDHGWIVGETGTVLLTTDGGKSWDAIETDKYFTTLNDIAFEDTKNGWAVGEQGVIMYSSDGGQTWQDQDSGVKKTLMSIAISPTDKTAAWVGGLEGTILATKDGGKTWSKKTLRSGEAEIDNHVYKVYEKESGTKGLGHNHVYTLSRNSQQYTFDDGFGWRPFMMDSETESLLNFGWLYDMTFRLDSDSVLDRDIGAGAVGESNYGWLVGTSGIILKTIDSQNWKRVH